MNTNNSQAPHLPQNAVITSFLGLDEPWDLHSVLEEMEKGVDILLHRFGYDGNNWEELQGCLEKSKIYREKINSYLRQINE